MTTGRDYSDYLTVTFDYPMPYEWSMGKHGSLFFHEIRENKSFVGMRCPHCKKVYVPPRRLCGPCFMELDEVVKLPNSGTIMGFTIVNYPFLGPEKGIQRPIPYSYAYIKIDGADTIFSHYLLETDPEKIKIGMKVRAVFREKDRMQGNIEDIKHFEIVG
jgi:uncharacterized protein